MTNKVLMFLFLSIICIGVYSFYSTSPPSGDAFEKMLIEKAGGNGGEVKLRDQASNSRYCFAPQVSDVSELLKREYARVPVTFKETDDSCERRSKSVHKCRNGGSDSVKDAMRAGGR
ncbi:MAG: hypothetical protein P8Y47_06130 [Alphaproteobacteria bacterium]